MDFPLNERLLAKARRVLAHRPGIYWVVGGSCSGKSTLCRSLSAAYGIPIYDMDAHIFGEYQGRYTPQRHPASTAWFLAGDPLAWALALSLDESYYLNRAANAEYLDLLADDLADADPEARLLIDGGITNPVLLAQVLPIGQIACLEIPFALSAQQWEEAPDRSGMKEAIEQLPNPQQAWDAFLAIDLLIHRTIVAECQASDIRIFHRDESTPPDALAREVASFFDL